MTARRAVLALAAGLLLLGAAARVAAAEPPAPGPPFPDPVVNRAVYDYAGVFSADTIASAEATIDAIEARTGAEIAVYTQVLGYVTTPEDATAHALALMNQWGVGRKGFDDGLVILFDLDSTRLHGQVQLYAGAGFQSTFLSQAERQRIYENDMLPRLRDGDLEGALTVALAKVDEAATADHAGVLDRARILDAILGLLVAPLAFFGLVGWIVFRWLRFGRDPVYLDDPSILMPAPPPDLTAAAGALIMEGQASRRALTTALLDLASRGRLAFREQKGLLGHSKVGIELEPEAGDATTEAARERNRRRPLSEAEENLATSLRSIAIGATYLEPDDVLKLGEKVPEFDERLEEHVTGRGWFTERPGAVLNRWRFRGAIILVAGIGLVVLAAQIPMAGLVAVGVAVAAAGGVWLVIASWMPAVTMAGAMIRAMLAAYRRTLEKTMEQARSMQQVVDDARLTWLETPDQAVVWATALGLQHDVERVLDRSLDDAREGRATSGTYFPAWYLGSSGSPTTVASAAASGGGIFSSSAIPSFGGMLAVLGGVGNSPSSGGGGGGFGGGGGGGGGGAGGGF
jgi:uncharacterized membrane protein YgcG